MAYSLSFGKGTYQFLVNFFNKYPNIYSREKDLHNKDPLKSPLLYMMEELFLEPYHEDVRDKILESKDRVLDLEDMKQWAKEELNE